MKAWIARHLWLAALLALAGSAAAGPVTMRHSGTVVEVGETTIVLAEVGPWRLEQGQTVVTYRTIEVSADTPLTIATREEAASSGFPGDFVVSTLVPWGLSPGDFVTVDCVHAGKQQIARAITVY